MEIFLLAAVDPNRGLFLTTDDGKLYPNPFVEDIEPDFEVFYNVIGRLIVSFSLSLSLLFLFLLCLCHSMMDMTGQMYSGQRVYRYLLLTVLSLQDRQPSQQ